MEHSTDENHRDRADQGESSEAGCLTWTLWTVVAGVLLSFFSVVYSVRFVGYSLLFESCPGGFGAGFTVPFVEFDRGSSNANDPPSTSFGMFANGEHVSAICPLGVVLNSIAWVLFTLAAAAFVRWYGQLPP